MTNSADSSDIRYPITVQRAMLMLPMYVVMTARVHGQISTEVLRNALEQVRHRHFLLGTRVGFNIDQTAYLTSANVSEFPVEVIQTKDDNRWQRLVEQYLATPFSLETRPLARFALVEGETSSHLIASAHHVICDGISLGYLMRDILTVCGSPLTTLEPLPVPPRVTQETAIEPLRISWLRRWIVSKVWQVWERKNIQFDTAKRDAMLERYFTANDEIDFHAGELSVPETDRLVARCHDEGVTVNSAVWVAVLSAQHRFLPRKRIHRTAGLARSLRPLLQPKVEDSFGFFAASMTFKLPYEPDLTFWNMVRKAHKQIHQRLKKENPFQQLILEIVHPGLVDSLYFQKLGFIDENLSRRMLKVAHWHKEFYGCAITNVGRLNIPHIYGALTIEAVHGPVVYSDVNEKTIGVATVAGRLTLSMTTDGHRIPFAKASRVLIEALQQLRANI